MEINFRPVRLAYQPPTSSTLLSEQTSHQQPDNRTNQPNKQAVYMKIVSFVEIYHFVVQTFFTCDLNNRHAI
jgi:hypothetical protein